MKTVTIVVEQSTETTAEYHEFECTATLQGVQYHNQLKEIAKILATYDKKNKNLTAEQQKLLDDIRNKCAGHFKNLFYLNEV